MIASLGITSAALVVCAAALGFPGLVLARDDRARPQPPQGEAATTPFHRTVVLNTALHGVEGKQMQAWVAELAPGAVIGSHYHPYDEFVYMLDGSVVLQVEGQAVQTLGVGDVGHAPAQTAHEARNGSEIFPAKALVFGLTVEGEPLAVPVT